MISEPALSKRLRLYSEVFEPETRIRHRCSRGDFLVGMKCAGNPRSTVLIRTRTASLRSSSSNRTARFFSAAILRRSRPTAERGHAQPHCPAEPGRHARHRLQPERERYRLCHRGAGGRQDSSGRRLYDALANGGGPATRNRIARLNRTARLTPSFNPNASGSVFAHRGAGGRQDFGGRQFHQHRRTDAQPHRPARCHDRPG